MDKCILYTALVTPYLNGKINYQLLEKIIEYQIKNNVEGIVVGGTTGLGTFHQNDLVELAINAIKYIKKRTKIIIGISEYKYENIKNLILKLNMLDVDEYLVLTPHYLTVSQDDLYEYYKTINDLSKHKIIIYHVPNRTGQLFLIKTMIKCLKLNNVIGIKLASFDLDMIKCIKRQCPTKKIFLGSDEKLDLINQGFDGIISVFSNINPGLIKISLENEQKKAKLLSFLAYFTKIPNPVGIISLMNKKEKMIDLPFPYTYPLKEENELVSKYKQLILDTSEMVIIGNGRMGKKINEYLLEYNPTIIDVRCLSKTEIEKIKSAKIIIDFSHPNSVDYYEQIKFLNNPIFIIGTTNYKTMDKIKSLSKMYPVMYDANFSLGINLIKSSLNVFKNKNILNKYNIKLSEIHHKNKIDAPSGTLLMLKNRINKECTIDVKRTANVNGIHIITLENENEKIVINHQLKNSNAILEGINKAIDFLIFKDNGLYNMEEVFSNGND